jgi:site-specific recombinase XerC
VIDARADVYAAAERRPLAEHLDDWRAAVVAKGVTRKQVVLLMSRAKSLLSTIGADHLSQLSPSAVQSAIAAMRDKGTSLKTCNHYLRAIKQFSRWLHRDGRTRSDDPSPPAQLQRGDRQAPRTATARNRGIALADNHNRIRPHVAEAERGRSGHALQGGGGDGLSCF